MDPQPRPGGGRSVIDLGSAEPERVLVGAGVGPGAGTSASAAPAGPLTRRAALRVERAASQERLGPTGHVIAKPRLEQTVGAPFPEPAPLPDLLPRARPATFSPSRGISLPSRRALRTPPSGVPTTQPAPAAPRTDDVPPGTLDDVLRSADSPQLTRREVRAREVAPRQQPKRSRKPSQASAPGTQRERRPAAEAPRRRTEPARGTRRLAQAPARRSPQQLSLNLPQVGIAGALGLATIAAPLTGLFDTPAKTVTGAAVRSSMTGAPVFPALAQPVNAVEDLRLIPEDGQASVPAVLSAPGQILVDRVSRNGERAVLPGCDGTVPITKMTNGKVPKANLCTLWDGDNQLRADAAVALAKLNIAYHKRFGRDMCVTDGYRSLARQYAVKQSRGGFAATPGTSEHGWGIAVDLCDGVQSRSSATYQWMRANAGAYGWYNPDWAQPGGSGPNEPWHWQYRPGEKSLGIDAN